MTNYRIRDLNKDEKPREKIFKSGTSGLSNEELLAVILRSGGRDESAIDLARKILIKSNGLENIANLDISELIKIKNIDLAKAAAVKAAFELGLRLSSHKPDNQITIKGPEEIFKLLKTELYGKTKEFLYTVSLNSRNKVISYDLISIGTVNETLFSPREIFKQALVRNAVSIILVHNHPSKDPEPSNDDVESTQKAVRAGAQMGIPILDHVIVCNNKYVSMKALNLLDPKKVQI
ncbi:hypothetical protein A2415_01450 [candidate division WWE3 bacterium RIFOXYC1_FULL_39_7]|uniref:MPN domain-containing protein n=1 Tax=candidate division WWE3 bacterium RIFOXYC1_FULL_39_7 TaxID=1802643 RepID=A0A1F4WKR1_UNCKA|nr:MAG: hypothetical protein A2415_01450 [candidate division WWE3 bacterium RIFOXYC1_FULL_39_7]